MTSPGGSTRSLEHEKVRAGREHNSKNEQLLRKSAANDKLAVDLEKDINGSVLSSPGNATLPELRKRETRSSPGNAALRESLQKPSRHARHERPPTSPDVARAVKITRERNAARDSATNLSIPSIERSRIVAERQRVSAQEQRRQQSVVRAAKAEQWNNFLAENFHETHSRAGRASPSKWMRDLNPKITPELARHVKELELQQRRTSRDTQSRPWRAHMAAPVRPPPRSVGMNSTTGGSATNNGMNASSSSPARTGEGVSPVLSKAFVSPNGASPDRESQLAADNDALRDAVITVHLLETIGVFGDAICAEVAMDGTVFPLADYFKASSMTLAWNAMLDFHAPRADAVVTMVFFAREDPSKLLGSVFFTIPSALRAPRDTTGPGAASNTSPSAQNQSPASASVDVWLPLDDAGRMVAHVEISRTFLAPGTFAANQMDNSADLNLDGVYDTPERVQAQPGHASAAVGGARTPSPKHPRSPKHTDDDHAELIVSRASPPPPPVAPPVRYTDLSALTQAPNDSAERVELTKHTGHVFISTVACGERSGLVASCDLAGNIHLSRRQGDVFQPVATLTHRKPILDLVMDEARDRLLVSDEVGAVVALSTTDLTEVLAVDATQGDPRRMLWRIGVLGPSGHVVAGTLGGEVLVVDMHGGAVVDMSKPHATIVSALKCVGDRAFTASFDGTVVLWRWGTEVVNKLQQLTSVQVTPPIKAPASRGGIVAMDVSSDGKVLVTTGIDHQLIVWDVDHDSMLKHATFSPGGAEVTAVCVAGSRADRIVVGGYGPALLITTLTGEVVSQITNLLPSRPCKLAPLDGFTVVGASLDKGHVRAFRFREAPEVALSPIGSANNTAAFPPVVVTASTPSGGANNTTTSTPLTAPSQPHGAPSTGTAATTTTAGPQPPVNAAVAALGRRTEPAPTASTVGMNDGDDTDNEAAPIKPTNDVSRATTPAPGGAGTTRTSTPQPTTAALGASTASLGTTQPSNTTPTNNNVATTAAPAKPAATRATTTAAVRPSARTDDATDDESVPALPASRAQPGPTSTLSPPSPERPAVMAATDSGTDNEYEGAQSLRNSRGGNAGVTMILPAPGHQGSLVASPPPVQRQPPAQPPRENVGAAAQRQATKPSATISSATPTTAKATATPDPALASSLAPASVVATTTTTAPAPAAPSRTTVLPPAAASTNVSAPAASTNTGAPTAAAAHPAPPKPTLIVGDGDATDDEANPIKPAASRAQPGPPVTAVNGTPTSGGGTPVTTSAASGPGNNGGGGNNTPGGSVAFVAPTIVTNNAPMAATPGAPKPVAYTAPVTAAAAAGSAKRDYDTESTRSI